jgi:ABC-type iron transport system FetAB ATPase subunit
VKEATKTWEGNLTKLDGENKQRLEAILAALNALPQRLLNDAVKQSLDQRIQQEVDRTVKEKVAAETQELRKQVAEIQKVVEQLRKSQASDSKSK